MGTSVTRGPVDVDSGPVVPLLEASADVLLLVKPQFELGRGEVGKGVVRDPEKHAAAVRRVAEAAIASSFQVHGVCPSPITGAKGNREFFLWLSTNRTTLTAIDLDLAIETATGTKS